MSKLSTWTIVKSLTFIGGVYLIYKMGTVKSNEEKDIDGQTFEEVYGKRPDEFVKSIMERNEL